MSTVVLEYCPHLAQDRFHKSKAKNRVFVGGRQSGKTKAGSHESVRLSFDCGENSVGFVGAPTYWHLTRCWDAILDVVGSAYKDLVVEVRRAEHLIKLYPNRRIWFRSAENPDGFRSQRWDWGWFDEAPLISSAAWNATEPALMGPCIFTGSPWGMNWLYGLFVRGQDPLEVAAGRVESWIVGTAENPYYPRDKIEEARRTLPDIVFRQEYLGEFVEDTGRFFRGIEERVRPLAQGPEPDTQYAVGCDLAKTQDYTVLVALDFEGNMRGFDRFHQLDWTFQRQRILDFGRRFNDARTLVDATGVGDPVVDELRKEGLNVEPYKITTNIAKANLVENLSRMLDDDRIHYPNIPELVNELRVFGYELSEGGTKQYRAPTGFHDDTVIALALAAWQLRRPLGPIVADHARRPR